MSEVYEAADEFMELMSLLLESEQQLSDVLTELESSN